jgi:hypothetical protein
VPFMVVEHAVPERAPATILISLIPAATICGVR